jgi:hypothetical protein
VVEDPLERQVREGRRLDAVQFSTAFLAAERSGDQPVSLLASGLAA